MKQFLIAYLFSVINPKVDNRINPIGIATNQPLFSWQLQSKENNVVQTAYRILIADDSLLLKKNIANVWDSKYVQSNESINIKYNGSNTLQSAKNISGKLS